MADTNDRLVTAIATVTTQKTDSDPIARGERGHFLPGNKGGPGRSRLPSWCGAHVDAALAVIVAQATGQTVPGYEHVVTEADLSASTEHRFAAAKWYVERICGKAKETIDVDVKSETTITQIARVIVDSVHAKPPALTAETVDVLPAKRDA
jgi:hypothetical protein